MYEEDDKSYGIFEEEEATKMLKYLKNNIIIKEVEDENRISIVNELKKFEEEDEKEERNNKLLIRKNNIENKNNNDYEEMNKNNYDILNEENKNLLSNSKIDINLLKTDSENKENSFSKSNYLNNNNNEDNNYFENSFLPQSVISQAKIHKLKISNNKLNNSFSSSSKKENSFEHKTPNKINKSIQIYSKSSSKEDNTKKNINLPRISSAQNLKKSKSRLFLMKTENENNHVKKRTKNIIPLNMNNHKSKLILKSKSPKNLLDILKKKKNDEIIDNELLNIEKENLDLIRELEKLNIQFNSLSQKKSSLINNNKNYNSVQPISHENLELSELNIQKKYLTNLISEYNTLYNKFNDENENEVIELKKEIKEKKNEINKCSEENKILKEKIFNNQNYLKTNKQKKVFFQDENLDDKSELYQKKILKKKKDIEKMKIFYLKENKKILNLNNEIDKYKEILNNYEKGVNMNLDKKKQLEDQIKKLTKKKKILKYSRYSMKKKFNKEINKQNNYIEQLKKTIFEVNLTSI